MTLSPASATLESLRSLPDQQSLLLALKDLKNTVIGNTWKKVEVAGDDDLKDFLLEQLSVTRIQDAVGVDIINETSVIIGALASDGPLTLRPLILGHAPTRLLDLVRAIMQSTLTTSQLNRVLSSVLRALRNILVAAADAVWGHMWGVGAERKVVGTGLVGVEIPEAIALDKGKGVAGRDDVWRHEAVNALSQIFESTNLPTLLSVLDRQEHPQTCLPIYQLLARLAIQRRHRSELRRWTGSMLDEWHSIQAGRSQSSSLGRSDDDHVKRTTELPFIVQHLMAMITDPSSSVRKATPKALEAALELLAALVKGDQWYAQVIQAWSVGRNKGSQTLALVVGASPKSPREPRELPEFLSLLFEFTQTVSPPIRIAAASCLATLLKVDQEQRSVAYEEAHHLLLTTVITLLETEALEDRIKLCFVIATVLADDREHAGAPVAGGCARQIIQLLHTIETEDDKGAISQDLASRGREGALLALAALAFPDDTYRTEISEADPSCLPHLLSALSHPSYGVRAAACQLARALSRTVSIVRTSLTDSGIADAVVGTLLREVSSRQDREKGSADSAAWDQSDDIEISGHRMWTVEVTAMMAVCNLISDFSPIKDKIISGPAMGVLCELARSSVEVVSLNALWTIKNGMFRSTECVKTQIVTALGTPYLRQLLSPPTPISLRVQALNIVQNYLADGSPSDLAKSVESIGEDAVLDFVTHAITHSADAQLRIAGLGVLVNLSWGMEKMRLSITSRPDLVESLTQCLDSKSDSVKHLALKSLCNLIITTTKISRVRPNMAAVFQPYQLKTRIKELADNSANLEVVSSAVALSDVLNSARTGTGTESVKEDVLDR